MDAGAGSGGAVGREDGTRTGAPGHHNTECLSRAERGGALARGKGKAPRSAGGRPAHLRGGPRLRRLHCLLLLVLLLLQLLGQLQVAKTQRGLRLLLQGQGNQVVLERGRQNRSGEVAGAWGTFRLALGFQTHFSSSDSRALPPEQNPQPSTFCVVTENTLQARRWSRGDRKVAQASRVMTSTRGDACYSPTSRSCLADGLSAPFPKSPHTWSTCRRFSGEPLPPPAPGPLPRE